MQKGPNVLCKPTGLNSKMSLLGSCPLLLGGLRGVINSLAGEKDIFASRGHVTALTWGLGSCILVRKTKVS